MSKFLALIFNFIARFWYYMKLFFIIYPIESYWRFNQRLDPRLYSVQRRINRTTDGRRVHEGGRFAVFVIYTKLGLQPFTRTAIDVLNKIGVNIVFVSNTKLSERMREELASNAFLVLERENLGRDFGAYKDGIHILRERVEDIDRLILMNDSVFYFPKGLEDVFSKLLGPEPFIGLTEVFEHHYHVQSFLVSFGRDVLEHKVFLQYWNNYKPISTRRWSIHKGEVGLTRAVVGKAGFQPTIIAHAGMLREYLRNGDFDDIKNYIDLLPVYFRDMLRGELYSLMDRTASQSPIARFSSSLSIGASGVTKGGGLPFFYSPDRAGSVVIPDFLAEDLKRDMLKVKGLVEDLAEFERLAFVERILDIINQRNQIHIAGFLFMKALSVPIIKRDIVFREVYNFTQVHEILDNLGVPFATEVMSDLRQKGLSRYFKGVSRVLYKFGSI